MRFIFIFLSIYLFAGNTLEYIQYNKQKALLGKKLFMDTILSKDRSVSCVSCHKFSEGGAENTQFSTGVFNRIDKPMNSQSIFNLPYNIAFFWNGRATNLKQQVLMAITDHNEFDMTPDEVVKRLNNNEKYKKLFNQIYHTDKISIDMVLEVISEFEKALITPDSKFDLFLKHKVSLTKKEKKGYQLFKRYGCIVCHNGANLGSNSFQKIGVVIEDYHFPRGRDRYQITKLDDDKYVYKVPSLRNIALTYPYFHDGSVKTLKEAISKMAYYNLGIKLKPDEIENIEIFLHTLTGKKPAILEGK
jgi:cytochrome c peroxidase